MVKLEKLLMERQFCKRLIKQEESSIVKRRGRLNYLKRELCSIEEKIIRNLDEPKGIS